MVVVVLRVLRAGEVGLGPVLALGRAPLGLSFLVEEGL